MAIKYIMDKVNNKKILDTNDVEYLIEEVIDTLIESRNNPDDTRLSEATNIMISIRDRWFKNLDF